MSLRTTQTQMPRGWTSPSASIRSCVLLLGFSPAFPRSLKYLSQLVCHFWLISLFDLAKAHTPLYYSRSCHVRIGSRSCFGRLEPTSVGGLWELHAEAYSTNAPNSRPACLSLIRMKIKQLVSQLQGVCVAVRCRPLLALYQKHRASPSYTKSPRHFPGLDQSSGRTVWTSGDLRIGSASAMHGGCRTKWGRCTT